MTKDIRLTLKIWRQENSHAKGRLETYSADSISTDMSFLEMLDVVNEQLTLAGKEPIAFDHDCREGICGQCGCVVNGRRPRASKKPQPCASSICAIFQMATPSISSPFAPEPSR